VLGLEGDRHVVAELGPVGDVEIRVEHRIVPMKQAQQGLHLWRLGFEVVTVQVQVLGRHPPAGLRGAALVGPLVGAEALVAVDVEDRHEDQGEAAQRALGHLPLEELS